MTSFKTKGGNTKGDIADGGVQKKKRVKAKINREGLKKAISKKDPKKLLPFVKELSQMQLAVLPPLVRVYDEKKYRFTNDIKRRVIEMCNHQCNICFIKYEGEGNLNKGFDIDHIVPFQHNGSNDISNLQLVCKDCHRNCKTTKLDKFFEMVATYQPEDMTYFDRNFTVELCRHYREYLLAVDNGSEPNLIKSDNYFWSLFKRIFGEFLLNFVRRYKVKKNCA